MRYILFLFICVNISAQDTLYVSSGLFDGKYIVYNIGDVYKITIEEANPFQPAQYRYVRIVDMKDGWIKYVWGFTLVEAMQDRYVHTDKRRDFYKYYLKRNEWELVDQK
jgi:hypothetical protein